MSVVRVAVNGVLCVGFMAVLCSCVERNADFSVPGHCTGRAIAKDKVYDSFTCTSVICCASACLLNSRCVSFRFSDGNCDLGSEQMYQHCGNSEVISSGFYFEKAMPCYNNGYLNSGQCVCINGYVGNSCERLMTDCTEGSTFAYYKDLHLEVVYIHPRLSPKPFPVKCWFRLSGRTYFLHRSDAALNFTRTWAEYENGFGDVSGDHWLGLRKIHYITNSRNHIMEYESYNKDEHYIQEYVQRFVIGNSTTNYALEAVVDESGVLGTCMTDALGRPFSTVDVDNDGDSSVNCADEFKSGWWFGSGPGCTSCNPTGPITSPASGVRDNVNDEVFWKDDNHGSYQVYMWFIGYG